VIVLVRLEYNNIKRLKKMSEMWRQAEGNNVVFIAKLDEFDRMMATVAVKDEQAMGTPRPGVLVEMFDLREGKLIIRIASR
jgi:hypothetical protein